MFVLNTNVISELRHGKPNQSEPVRQWAAQQPTSQLFLSAITRNTQDFVDTGVALLNPWGQEA